MYSEVSSRDIYLSEMRIDQSYSHRLTYAACLLQRMRRGDVRAFDEARKEFEWLQDEPSYKVIYNKLWGWVKWGWSPKRKMDVTDDEYASAEEWSAFFKWRREQVISSGNTSDV